ncbi:hypothetical protein AAC978_11155 [Desulfitobacterium sp. THU1]|uniref:SLAC1 family transporter n=1 Tax=Desulfitobacterium sp. THU1 TaxID=3138072 RepID=UPI00311FC729
MCILLFSLWILSAIGVSFFIYRKISFRKALRDRTFVTRIVEQSLTSAELNSFLVYLLGIVGLAIGIIFNLAENLQLMGLVDGAQLLKLLACCFWGFGVWIIGFTLIPWCYHKWTKKMPIKIEWGIFIFSFQVYTIASQKIAEEFLSPLTSGVSLFLTFFLTVHWLCFWRSKVGIVIHSIGYLDMKQKRSRV